jgi:hypothetical protein
MKLRKTNEPKCRIDLDREVMADLEASDTETESVRGGGTTAEPRRRRSDGRRRDARAHRTDVELIADLDVGDEEMTRLRGGYSG